MIQVSKKEVENLLAFHWGLHRSLSSEDQAAEPCLREDTLRCAAQGVQLRLCPYPARLANRIHAGCGAVHNISLPHLLYHEVGEGAGVCGRRLGP
mmetsp:Transcript_26306/g.49665  ORF Transcript_26306/g.49665 Transcript_26306/m.49665 type:complete len:95 (+) Transcript_26306:196-480(+)